MGKKRLFLLSLFSFFILEVSDPLLSQSERIKIFRSDIGIEKDGSMTVTETLVVSAAGEQIKRGIYRDFPTRYKDRFNNNYSVLFKVLSVRKNGIREPYVIENISNGKRVRIGQQNVFLDPGDYTYEIAYSTSRQLGFFPDHDELYWNVTGNGWVFPIDRVVCRVRIPAVVNEDLIKAAGYTGYQNEKGGDFTFSISGGTTVHFSSTRSLRTGEGLSIVVGWPKGLVKEPTPREKFGYFINDNIGILIGALGIIILLFYYLLVWFGVGRDPKKGTIIPLFSPPENISPAAMRYLMKMNFDHKCFSAALINMAVKKAITIENDEGDYTLHKTGSGEESLSSEERKLAGELFGDNQSIKLDRKHHTDMAYALAAVEKSLKNNYFKKYFLKNSLYLIPGILISLITLVAIILFQGLTGGRPEMLAAGFFILFWLSGWTTGVFFVTKHILAVWKSFKAGKSAGGLASAASMTLFAVPFWIGELFGLGILVYLTSLWIASFLVFMIGLALLFHHLLKTPTVIGRQLMDKIEGFKLYLSVTEKDRLNMFVPPSRTTALFEKYLPYALALDVENQWAEQFSGIFVRPEGGEPSYHPVWYTGGPIIISRINSSIGSSFTSAVTASSTPPGSSSGFGGGGGGGGGSSGGGGGGGGGGGW